MQKANKQPWYLYMIRCRNGSLYTGITIDVERRLAEHQSQGKKCAKYLKGKGPLELVYSEEAGDRQKALSAEIRVKSQTKANKEKMIKQAMLKR